MKKVYLIALIVNFVFFGKTSDAQTLELGILSSFEAFTGAGAVSNGGDLVTGDVGTNNGIITGFMDPEYIDNEYNEDSITESCRFDLFRVYIHLNDLFVTYPGTHAPTFGGGETISPGVYSSIGAGAIIGALTLDGGGDPNAYFVIKCNGALTIGAGSTVTLINGVKACNVFWIAEGAITVAASADIKGTLFAHIGAVGLGVNAILEGRMFTLEGAITIGSGAEASKPLGISTIPIFCESDCTPAPAVDVLGVLSDFALYTSFGAVGNTSTSGFDGNIGSDGGALTGFNSSVLIGDFNSADALTAQANIDLNSAYASLMALTNTVAHLAIFGAGETIFPGVYNIASAGSLGGTITLDGQNDPDAIFVFKFGGAFSVAAASKIILTNGTRRCNVFWIGGAGVATGAITIGAASVLKGTFLSHGGACNTGGGVFLAGRQLSTAGAVNTYSGVVYNNPVCVTSSSLSLAVITAVADTVGQVNGTTGGVNVINVLANDSFNGSAVTIAQVNLTTVTPSSYLTLNADGSIDVAPNTPFGTHTLTYQICDTSDPTNCVSSLVTLESVSCVQPPEPATSCGETATFDAATCSWSIETPVSFIKNTLAGISDEVSSCWGMAWGDYDNDGFDDLFVPVKTINQPSILYHNNTDGTFTKATTGAIVSDLGAAVSGTWGDYDNDGFIDLFVAYSENSTNKLYHNNGDGTFTSIASNPVVDEGIYTHSAAWADYNKDGYLDIVVSDFHPTDFNFLFLGDGLGGFSIDASSEVSLSATSAVGVAWGDYDNDGDADLFIANTNGENNQLFKNVNGVLIEETLGTVVNDAGHSVGGTWGDCDNDGDLDLYVTNSTEVEPNFFYQNNGDGTFLKITDSEIVNYLSNSHGASWIDFDNDGDLDLMVANNQSNENFLFSNNGDGTFEKLDNAITQDLNESYGSAWSDFDNDGDYDLFVANIGANTNDFFVNQKEACTNYITVKLNGCNSNKVGVGAMVSLKATINGQSIWQTKHVSTQTSAMGGQNSPKLLFGLLDATEVDSVTVVWPSGVVSYIVEPTINDLLPVSEACGSKICGTVYFDENQNNIQDPSEPGIPNQKIIATPGDIQVYTDQNGAYAFFVSDGNYTLSQEMSGGWNQFSPLVDHTINVVEFDAVEYCGIDFGNTNTCISPDLEISLGTTSFRRGLTNEFQVLVKNSAAYSTTDPVQISLEFSENTYLVYDSWSSVSENSGYRTYIYDLNQMMPLSDTILMLTDSVANDALLGEVVSVKGTIIYAGSECSMNTNFISISDIVVGSIDPNDKLVFVEGRGVQDTVSEEETLIYKIRFQNVGTCAARRVRIVDQLSEDLDWGSFKFRSSSHHFEYSIIDGHLAFFNNHIELPDSTSDSEGSNGYIEFSIGIHSQLSPFTLIKNQALIQFDFNDFIETNTAEIVVTPNDYLDRLHVFIYPNPTVLESTVMLIDAKQNRREIQKIEICNLQGQVLRTIRVASDEVLVGFSNENPGMYLVRVYDQNESKFTSKVIKKR
jgi:hypothetical protein